MKSWYNGNMEEVMLVKTKVYLDNCCFNRPYDNQGNLLVKLETEAKLKIQQMAKEGELDLVWSFVLDFENAANPYEAKRKAIEKWRDVAVQIMQLSDETAKLSDMNMKLGLRQKDAAHLACAMVAKADFFITTDKKILNKPIENIETVNPIDFLRRYFDV